ncbi:MAG: ABC transporter permease [Desulfovibrio sp.]|nr:MAG: ABC transporter permease [Desulfovibrio sp.]
MLARLAWRNIWRNPKRTLIIVLAVLIGVWSLVTFVGFSMGMVESIRVTGIATLTGHIQIHGQGYRDDPVIENRIADSEAMRQALNQALPSGSLVSERIRLSGVASNARHSSGITLVGIDPDQEMAVSFLGNGVSEGRMLTQDDGNKIVVGRALLETFETEIGKKLVLMSQGVDGEIESRAFRIVGVFDAEMEGTEKNFVFVLKSSAQDMLGLGQELLEVCIVLPDPEQLNPVAENLRTALAESGADSPPLEVHTWEDLLPLVILYLEVFDSFMYLWWLVVFIAMAFGIVNTMLMAVLERMREFGLLKALGMRPRSIVSMVLLESSFLLFLGLALGTLCGSLTVLLLAKTGINLSAMAQGSEYMGMSRVIYPVLDLANLITGNLMILLLGLLVCLYPAIKAGRITPVKALAHT